MAGQKLFEFEAFEIGKDTLVIESGIEDKDSQDAAPEPEPEIPPAPTFSEEELEAARAEGFATGHAQGITEVEGKMRDSVEARLTATLSSLAERLRMLEEDETKRNATAQRDAINLTLTMTRKILPEYAKRFGLNEIEGLLVQCISERMEEPRMVVRLPDELLDPMKSRLDGLTAQRGYEGKVVLIADPEISGQDCTIEWADGGVARRQETSWTSMEATASELAQTLDPADPSVSETQAPTPPSIKPLPDASPATPPHNAYQQTQQQPTAANPAATTVAHPGAHPGTTSAAGTASSPTPEPIPEDPGTMPHPPETNPSGVSVSA